MHVHNITHYNIKPENIMLMRDVTDKESFVLSDDGIDENLYYEILSNDK